MPKLRITQKGWAGFTGNLGGVEFVDAVSVHDVSPVIANRLTAIVSMEDTDTGKNPSVTQALIDARGISMDKDMPPAKLVEVDERRASPKPAPAMKPYTREMLEKIATEDGIAGIRAIATPAGISGKSINALISAIIGRGLASNLPVDGRVPGDDANSLSAEQGERRLAPSAAPARVVKNPTPPAPIADAETDE